MSFVLPRSVSISGVFVTHYSNRYNPTKLGDNIIIDGIHKPERYSKYIASLITSIDKYYMELNQLLNRYPLEKSVVLYEGNAYDVWVRYAHTEQRAIQYVMELIREVSQIFKAKEVDIDEYALELLHDSTKKIMDYLKVPFDTVPKAFNVAVDTLTRMSGMSIDIDGIYAIHACLTKMVNILQNVDIDVEIDMDTPKNLDFKLVEIMASASVLIDQYLPIGQ